MAEELRVLASPQTGRRERVWVFDFEVKCDRCGTVIVAGTGAKRWMDKKRGCFSFGHQDSRLCFIFYKETLALLREQGLI